MTQRCYKGDLEKVDLLSFLRWESLLSEVKPKTIIKVVAKLNIGPGSALWLPDLCLTWMGPEEGR